MALVSSKTGNAKWDGSDIPHSRGWNFSAISDNKQFASSDTAGHVSRVAGHKDHNGTVRAYVESASDIEGVLREADLGSLTLYEDATRFWTFPAIIDSIEVTAEIEGGEIVEVSINWSATGALTVPT